MLFLASYLSSAKIAHCDSNHGGLVPFGAFELPPQVNDALHLHLLWQPDWSMVGKKLSLQFRVLGWILSQQGKFHARPSEQSMFQGVFTAIFLPSRCSRSRRFLGISPVGDQFADGSRFSVLAGCRRRWSLVRFDWKGAGVLRHIARPEPHSVLACGAYIVHAIWGVHNRGSR